MLEVGRHTTQPSGDAPSGTSEAPSLDQQPTQQFSPTSSTSRRAGRHLRSGAGRVDTVEAGDATDSLALLNTANLRTRRIGQPASDVASLEAMFSTAPISIADASTAAANGLVDNRIPAVVPQAASAPAFDQAFTQTSAQPTFAAMASSMPGTTSGTMPGTTSGATSGTAGAWAPPPPPPLPAGGAVPPSLPSDFSVRPGDRPARRGRLLRLVAPGAALATVAAGVLIYTTTQADTTVSLSIDGKSTQVSSGADTVGDLLAAQSMSLSAGDQVSPAVGEQLTDGQQITVKYARPLTLVVDGVKKAYTTTETTLAGAVGTLGVDVEGAKLSMPLQTELNREGTTVTVTTPKTVSLSVGGRPAATLTSTAATVAELLKERNITTDADDKVSAAGTAPVTADMKVVVTVIDSKQVTATESVPFETKRTKDSSLAKGTTKVITKGVKGERTATYQVTYTNGEVTSKKLISAEVTTEPKDGEVKVGTKSAPSSDSSSDSSSDAGSSTGTSADGLNWAALAKCESGGNPRAVNPSGKYFGLYQFSKTTWRAVGGSGSPADASAAEQTKRAKILYNRAGAGQWPHCGPRLFS